MEANWVQSKLLLHLGPKSHTGENLRLVKNLQRLGASTLHGLSAHITKGTTPTTFGFDYLPAGIRFIRSQNIGEISVGGDFAFISTACDEALKRSRIRRDDVLLNIVGASIGRAAVYLSDEPANTNQAVAIIRLPQTNDSAFLAAWLNSNVCQRLIYAEQSGLARDNFDLYQVGDLLVPTLLAATRNYIGEKVRQAERLREHARSAEQTFAGTLHSRYSEVFGAQKEFGRCSRVGAVSLRRDLNPGAFNPERLRIRSEIKKAGGRELSELATIEASVTDSFGPDDDYIGLDAISSATSQLNPVKVAQAEVEGASRVLREGPIISKLRPYLNKVGYIPAELAHAVGSTELLCVRPKPGVSGWFVYGVLKLQCTVRQFQPLANGSTLPRIDAEDVLEVMVPWHEDADRLGLDLERAQAMYFAAEKLTTAAKLLVEALIEGKVTEAELVLAQEALERGDATADRALLRRLTRQGLDVPGQPPLFPDLDALYTLLAQTQKAEP